VIGSCRRIRRRVPAGARVVNLVARWAEEQTGRVHEFADGEDEKEERGGGEVGK